MEKISRISLLFLSLLLLVNCNKKAEQNKELEVTTQTDGKSAQKIELKKNLDSLEMKMKTVLDTAKNPSSLIAPVMETMNAYQNLALLDPKDSSAPTLLFKRAKLYEDVLNDPVRALQNYRDIRDQYPDYKKRMLLLFHIGNTYHTLGDTGWAIYHYNKIIEENPRNEFIRDADRMIKLIRKEAKSKKLKSSD